jgi:hypothetical protein
MADDCADDDQALAADCAYGDVAVAKIVGPHSCNARGLADAAPGLVEVLERRSSPAAGADPRSLLRRFSQEL